MPIGQPDSVETLADRLISEAMEAGAFDKLAGSGRPLPGTGMHDEDGWWIRGWVERNRQTDDSEPSNSS